MNFNHRLFVCLLFSLFISFSAFSQINALSAQDLSSVNIDKVTDEEISAYYQKAVDNGLDESDIYKILRERGLPKEELDKIPERLQKINVDQKNTDKKEDKKTSKTENKSRYTDENDKKPKKLVDEKPVKKELEVFGSELFSSDNLVFEPNLRIATPAGYILGPDDELIINIFGYSEKTYNVTINQEGNIYIPQVGPLFLNGLTIEQATLKIRSRLAATIYKAITTGQTQVQISLGKIRSIRITVIGEATKPGTITVSSLTTLFNLLYLCGGPSDLGSYRKIELIRGNELKKTIDLYSFLLKGDQKDNILLQDGDVVRIPYYKIRVLLTGNVKRKAKYELIENETFDKLLDYSGGFSDDAYKSGITVYQLTETQRKIIDVSKNQYSAYKPLSSDSIVVGKLLNRFENKLSIKGAVMRPGEYELSIGVTLKQLIEKAGGVKEDVYNRRGSISRLSAYNTPVQVSFDIDSIMNNLVNINLKKNDEITIYSIFDLKTPNEINIDGFVNRPGKYKWAENITLQDIILSAGGLMETGDNKNIEIARRINNINLTESNYLQTEIITVDISDSSKANDVKLNPFDVINVRQKSGYSNQRTVFIEGKVINPGRYTLQMSGDRISDVMKRTGGLRPNADSTSVILRRPVKKNQSETERQRIYSKLLNITEDSLNQAAPIRKEIFKDYDNISVDLNLALHQPQSTENLLLEDGDVLTIEQNNNLIKVTGEVYFPTITPFKKNASLEYYIQKSGSYTELARKSRAIVIYPDGKAKRVKRFLFFKSYPEVVARSEIFVPKKSNSNKSRISIGEWSVVLSSLAIIANVIINSKK